MNLLHILILIFSFPSCHKKSYYIEELPGILGVSEVEVTENFVIEEFAGFQGEGYIYEEITISSKTVNHFMDNPNFQIPELSDWNRFGWNKSPIDKTYIEVVKMATNYKSRNHLQNYISTLNNFTNDGQKDFFYAFYYKKNLNDLSHIQLFIFDFTSLKIYIVDHKI